MPAKRIVMVTETFEPEIGGGETQARTVADALTGRGFDVTLVTRRSRAHLPEREEQGRLTIVRIPPAGPGRYRKWGLAMTAFPAVYDAARDAMGVMVSGFRILGPASVTAARLNKVPVFLKGDNRGELSGDYFRAGLEKFQLSPRSVPIRMFLGVRNAMLRKATGFVALSGEMAREYGENGVPPHRIHRIPNGVDVVRFSPVSHEAKRELRHRLGLPAGRIVLFTGRLVTHKGLPQLVSAWNRLGDSRQDATLVLVGEGGADMHACENELRAFVAEHHLEQTVRFTGPVTNVLDYLRAADAFAFPSVMDGLPLSLLEAMSCELPVISTHVGGMADFLVDGHNGLVVPVGDEEALGGALRRVIAGGTDIAALGRTGRVTVVQRFSHHAVAAQWLQLFDAAAS